MMVATRQWDYGNKFTNPGCPNGNCLRSQTNQTETAFALSMLTKAGVAANKIMLGQPLFPGESGIDQLVEIIKVLGTPTRDQIRTMNPNYMEHKFPQIKPHPFSKVSSTTKDGIELQIDFFAGL